MKKKLIYNMKDETKAKFVIISEILFTLLPIVIILMIFIIQSNLIKILKSPDLSFAAIVLFGQTIVRLASGIAKNKKSKSWQAISFIMSLIIIFGLIPASLFLVIIYLNIYDNLVLYIFQLIIFVVSIVSYIIFGTLGQVLLDEEN